MQVEYIYGARSLMKIIDILSDDRDGSHRSGHLAQRQVRCIGLSLRKLLSSPQVPSPNQAWIFSECFRCFQSIGVVAGPKSSQFFPVGGDSAFY